MRPHLSSFENAWTDAAAAAIFPEPAPPDASEAERAHGSHLPQGVLSMHPARFLEDVLMHAPFEQSVGLRLTLWMVALAPLFTIGRLGTIASIGEADRIRVLDRLLGSRLYAVRQLALSFKAVITLLYVQSPAVRRAMTTPLARGTAGAADERGADGLVSATRLTARVAGRGAQRADEEADHAAA
ncbi:MAG: hypothetical protein JWP97_2001 [Labilithrix sp.]|nr:hypothetical protein [Labilithrix sp.]